MVCTENKIVDEMICLCKFKKITSSGLNESYMQNVIITKESLNYIGG